MEVTLKKSSSGTWEVPEFLKRRFKPYCPDYLSERSHLKQYS
jgi:hypothetical protein